MLQNLNIKHLWWSPRHRSATLLCNGTGIFLWILKFFWNNFIIGHLGATGFDPVIIRVLEDDIRTQLISSKFIIKLNLKITTPCLLSSPHTMECLKSSHISRKVRSSIMLVLIHFTSNTVLMKFLSAYPL